MKTVFKHENRGIVYSVKNVLEMNGIDCHVKNDFGNPMGPEFGIDNVQLELCVTDDDDRDRALAVIEDQVSHPAGGGRPWTCPNCGEENAGNFGLCWNCQQPAPNAE